MNCSCTQVKRSSRASPLCTRFSSGQTMAGLVFCTMIAVTGGPFLRASASPVRIAPRRDWSSSRTEGSMSSEASIRFFLSG